MKFLPLIWKNVMRNELRSLFTCMSIAVSLFLVTLLYAYMAMQAEIAENNKGQNRLMVMHQSGLTALLPLQHVDRVRAVEGVKVATAWNWFGGKYKDDRIPFAQFATDPKLVFQILDDLVVPPDQLAAFERDRTGCVVGTKIAAEKGWKLGDKIVLKGDIYPVDLELTVRGIYDGKTESADRKMLFFNWLYLDELLRNRREVFAGMTGTVFLKTESTDDIPEVMRKIDSQFASSDAPTRTMTEQAFRQMFTEMLGNVRAFIRNTALAVVFSLICVAANGMAMALRERTREVAVLRSIGFGRILVMSLVLGEAVAIAVVGGVIGSLGGKLLFMLFDITLTAIPGMAGGFYIPWSTALGGLALAVAIGLASGVVPAWQAARVSVVDGLRKVV